MCPRSGAVHLGGFHGVHGTGLQAGEQDEHHERRPLPDQGDDDGHQGRRDSRSGWGGVSLPKSDQIQVRVPLIRP